MCSAFKIIHFQKITVNLANSRGLPCHILACCQLPVFVSWLHLITAETLHQSGHKILLFILCFSIVVDQKVDVLPVISI